MLSSLCIITILLNYCCCRIIVNDSFSSEVLDTSIWKIDTGCSFGQQTLNRAKVSIENGELKSSNSGKLMTPLMNPKCSLIIEGMWRYSGATDGYRSLGGSYSDILKIQTRVDDSSGYNYIYNPTGASVLSDCDFRTGISTRIGTYDLDVEPGIVDLFALDVNSINFPFSLINDTISIQPNSRVYFRIQDSKTRITAYYRDTVNGGELLATATVSPPNVPYRIAMFNRYSIFYDEGNLVIDSWFDNITISTYSDPTFIGNPLSTSLDSLTVSLSIGNVLYDDILPPTIEIDWGDNITSNLTMQRISGVFSVPVQKHNYSNYGDYTIGVRLRDNCDFYSDWITQQVGVLISTGSINFPVTTASFITTSLPLNNEISSIPTPVDESKGGLVVAIATSLVAGIAVVVTAIVISCFLWNRKFNKTEVETELPNIEEAPKQSGLSEALTPKALSLQSQALYSKVTYEGTVIPLSQIRFLEVLGKGSFGVVRKGVWNKKFVALKEVSEETLQEDAVSEMMKEAKIMEAIPPHPNVLQFLGLSNFPQEQLIIISEFCSEGSLINYILARNMLEKTFVKSCLIGIAKGLAHIHKAGLVHRDIAARNILLTENFEPKVSDFGMTRKLQTNESEHLTKSAIGPVRWMSPESLTSRIYSAKTDVWSFGVVIAEVVTKKTPLHHLSNLECAQYVAATESDIPIPSSVDEFLANVMKLCFKRKPSERPTCEEIVGIMEGYK